MRCMKKPRSGTRSRFCLDSKTSVQIMSLFEDLHSQGKTLIVVTHEPDIDAYAHSHIVVKDGKILSCRR